VASRAAKERVMPVTELAQVKWPVYLVFRCYTETVTEKLKQTKKEFTTQAKKKIIKWQGCL